MDEFYDPSPVAKAAFEGKELTSGKKWKYADKLEALPIGKVFLIPVNEIKSTTLRPIVSRKGKELNRNFKVFDHNDKVPAVFEILRLPDPVPDKPRPPFPPIASSGQDSPERINTGAAQGHGLSFWQQTQPKTGEGE